MIYAFETTDVDTNGQSTKMDITDEEYIGAFTTQKEAFDAFLAYADERLEAELKGGSKVKNVIVGRDYYSFDYCPDGWYDWIREYHWLFVYNK